ncbi:MAG: ATP-binding protein [Patescibacteria group bacterium]
MEWYFPISALINFLTISLLGFLGYFKNRKEKINIIFGLFCFSAALYSFSYFIWQISGNYFLALFWVKMLMAGAIFISLLYFHVNLIFLGLECKYKKILYILYPIYLIFLLLDLFTNQFIIGVYPKMFFKFWPTAGPVFIIFLLFWFYAIIHTVILQLQVYPKCPELKKIQIKYLFIGSLIGFIGGSTNYLLWYDIKIAPFGNILISVFAIMMTYSIVRYRFLDTKIFIRKSVFYLLLALIIIGLYSGIFIFLKIINPNSAILNYGIAGLFATVLAVLIFPRLENFFQKNKLFFRSQYDHSDALKDLSATLNSTIDFSLLTHKTFIVFENIFKVKKAAFFLYESNGEPHKMVGFKTYGFSERIKDAVNLYKDYLFNFFAKSREVILLQELPYKIIEVKQDAKRKEELVRVMEFLRSLNVAVALPIYYKNKLIALFVLAEKEKKEVYSAQDIQLLETFANSAAIAIENIKSYQKLKNYSENLKKEVDIQTAELRELNEKQSQFMVDISHELQSPIAIIQGNLNLVQKNGCQEQFINNSLSSVSRLSKLINDLLFLAKADFGQLEFREEKIDLQKLLHNIYEETTIFAEENKISYQLSALEKITVIGDSEKLKGAFLNILSNAFKNSQPGDQIKIKLGKNKQTAILEFANSGSLIPPNQTSLIFERFYRVKHPETKEKRGTGLGLAITKAIIEGHGGQIEVKSKKGKGTMFKIVLPINMSS